MFCTVALAVALASAPPPSGHGLPNPWSPNGVVIVRLIDVFTAQPVARSDVRVFSDNGIRCFRAPCPTDGAEWKGRTDSRGYVAIPSAALNRMTSVSTPLHKGGTLTLDSPRDAEGARIVEVLPTSLDSGGPLDLGAEAFKLVDARSGKPIANTVIQLVFRRNGSLESRTNALGYVFVPREKVAAADDDISVMAPGYRRAKLDSGPDDVTRLEPR